MRVLYDTNVILDALLARQPYATDAAKLMAMAERKIIDGFLCATTITTLYYILAKATDDTVARVRITSLLNLFDSAAVNRSVLQSALRLPFKDYEDAVLHEAAQLAGADAIVTRNGRDFRQATLPIYSPVELLAALATSND
ncbi:MAG: PIN domain-containing protein [Caldilineaceae bacterium]|nr:PIN domain-containing protein [Caldilineaceae bacterium]HRJ42456.1 PIN domain-containing protein [Caldilineaceae bacterium]